MWRRRCLDGINRVLGPANLRINTLTAARQEQRRYAQVLARRGFEDPIYVEAPAFRSERFREVLSRLPDFADRFATFENAQANEVGFEFSNSYYSSPDVEVLYSLLRQRKPARILEIGCGHSTKVIRQAIRDGGFRCHHVCVDPRPREEISQFADEFIRAPIETLDPAELAKPLGPEDVLFIDTSHELRTANDVAFIYGRLLPLLRSGVNVHIHDIFLPYEYPHDWVVSLGLTWTEQYIVQAMLFGGGWSVLWAGYYLQRTLPDFSAHFPHAGSGMALSLWLQKL